MFGLFGKKKVAELEHETKKCFEAVKKDIEGVGQWIKHLDSKDKHVFGHVSDLKREIATLKDEFEELKELVGVGRLAEEHGQMSKKPTTVDRQTAVLNVQKPVQTSVQTGGFYSILQGLSANERLIVFTLMNSADDMKLSYEDLARLLGKERSTIRGQINAIKQKSEGLIQEHVESNGKKRVYIEAEIKEKLSKYAKVRVKGKGNYKKLPKMGEIEEYDE